MLIKIGGFHLKKDVYLPYSVNESDLLTDAVDALKGIFGGEKEV
jgi:hypothetical protein